MAIAQHPAGTHSGYGHSTASSWEGTAPEFLETDVLTELAHLKQSKESGGLYRFPLIPVHGVPLMKPIVDDWKRVEKFQARPDDILISTYPKAGTTWIQEIVDCIMNDGKLEKTSRAPTHVRSPFMELSLPSPFPCGIDDLEKTPSPRLVKTHLPYELVPKSLWEQKCKTIYVARNAKDNLVSYFFFSKMCTILPDPGTLDQYLESFLKGDVPWGSWFDHVIGWWNARDKQVILYLFYEDMKENPKQEIQKVIKFLEKNLSDEVVENICQHTSFKAMKENPMANQTSFPVFDHKVSPFMRKGEVADWINHFSEAQNKYFEVEYAKKMKGTDLTFRMKI